MPRRSRQVMSGHTKEERKQERKKVGRLRNQIVTQGTEARYKDTFEEFMTFHSLQTGFTITSMVQFDELVGEYVEELWEMGSPKSQANYTLAAIQFYRPEVKGHLTWSWKLVKAWNQLGVPQRATPLSPPLLLGYCGVALKWGQQTFAELLLVGFSTFLRTGELLALRPIDVTLSRTTAILFIADSKGAKRNFLPLERVEVEDQLAIQALRSLMRRARPHQPFWEGPRPHFMALWHSVTAHLGLQDMGFKPYSLRRGGATSAYRGGVTLDALLTKGRWKNTSTARIYLDTGLPAPNRLD